MKLKHAAMVLGLAIGIWLVFFSDSSPDGGVVEAVAKPSGSKFATTEVTATGSSKSSSKNERVIPILKLLPRETLISVGHTGLDGKKIAGASVIFGTQSWVPPPPPPDPNLKKLPPPAPVAPPLNFTYLGKKQEGGVWEVYLARGENSYIVRNQDVIDGTYRVDSVTPNALVLTYLPLNQVQQLDIRG